MAFNRPTLKTIVQRIEADFKSGLSLQAILRRSFLGVMSRAWAAVSHVLHGHISYGINKKFFPDNGDEETVIRWGTLYRLPRNPATFTKLVLEVTATTGGVIETSSLYVRADGVEYSPDVETTLANEEVAQIIVTAQTAGTTGNLSDGDTLSLQSSIAGVLSEATVVSTNTEGEDQEPIENYRTRVLERLGSPPSGGTVSDFVAFAKTVTGVTRVWVLPGHVGEGSVGLTFVEDAENPIIPDAAKVNEVQLAVTELMPVETDLYTFAPTERELNPQIQIKPNTIAVRNAVIAELNDLMAREAQVRGASDPDQVGLGVQFDGRIKISQIGEAISIAAGEQDHVIISPSADVFPQVGGIVTLGTPTFTTLP